MGRKTNSIKKQIEKRLGKEQINKQGCLMKIIEYVDANNIIVKFLDKYETKVHTQYSAFERCDVKNPYYPSVLGVGITGNKYSSKTKEYQTWRNMIIRCFTNKEKERHPTYKDVTCCDEWLLFDNFYEWLHNQENFDKWLNNEKWCIDKDILVKGNKIYSPDTCCLVPHIINCLFIKCDKSRNGLPIGVHLVGNKFKARCQNPITKQRYDLGNFTTPEDAFYLGYKPYKENIIKQIAELEYSKGNITEKCYNAMMNYEVEIDD